ncbi:hypothetical protein HEP_00247500 [Hepatocystis sp. ex Piliocolobus tephrosceles]|nr:hypothetical protein HEP_00247500 [Hepatocystis sp. ex Piliocolobus tephrosceles]
MSKKSKKSIDAGAKNGQKNTTLTKGGFSKNNASIILKNVIEMEDAEFHSNKHINISPNLKNKVNRNDNFMKTSFDNSSLNLNKETYLKTLTFNLNNEDKSEMNHPNGLSENFSECLQHINSNNKKTDNEDANNLEVKKFYNPLDTVGNIEENEIDKTGDDSLSNSNVTIPKIPKTSIIKKVFKFIFKPFYKANRVVKGDVKKEEKKEKRK